MTDAVPRYQITMFARDTGPGRDTGQLRPVCSFKPHGDRWRDEVGLEWWINGVLIREPNDTWEYGSSILLPVFTTVIAALRREHSSGDFQVETTPMKAGRAAFRYFFRDRKGRVVVDRSAIGEVERVASSVLEHADAIAAHFDAIAPPAPRGEVSPWGSRQFGEEWHRDRGTIRELLGQRRRWTEWSQEH